MYMKTYLKTSETVKTSGKNLMLGIILGFTSKTKWLHLFLAGSLVLGVRHGNAPLLDGFDCCHNVCFPGPVVQRQNGPSSDESEAQRRYNVLDCWTTSGTNKSIF